MIPEIPILLSDQQGRTLLKTAAAVLGKWENKAFGTVEFTQKDFDQAVDNFKQGVVGYNPPAYLGHPVSLSKLNNTDPAQAVYTIGGAPRTGQVVALEQEDNVLYAYIEPKKSVDPIKLKEDYGYVSLEILRNGLDKQGQPVGSLITAIALTNQPFVPTFIENELVHVDDIKQRFSFSNDAADKTYFLISTRMNNPVNTPSQKLTMTQPTSPDSPMPNNTPDTPVSIDSQLLLDTHTQLLSAVAELNILKQDKQLLTQQLSQHATALEEMAQQRKQDITNSFVDLVQKLSLPQAMKDLHVSLFQSGSLTQEQMTNTVATLTDMSQTNTQALTQPAGFTSDTQLLTANESETSGGAAKPSVSYSTTIRDNLQRAKAKFESQGYGFDSSAFDTLLQQPQ